MGTVAEALQRPVPFLEKDFWAMEVLRVASVDRQIELEDGTGVVQTVFKGGTSLSRVYGLIDRFSEDIDLLVSFPNDGGGPGVNRRDRLLKSIQAEVHAHLGQETVSVERLTSKTGVARKIKYHYPLRTAAHNALAEGVILEMGSRGGLEPMERRLLRSIIADRAISQLGDSEDQWEQFTPFEVNVLTMPVVRGSAVPSRTRRTRTAFCANIFPKRTGLFQHSRVDLERVERELNHRPRAVVDDGSPTEIFTQLLTFTPVPMLQPPLETT